MKAAKEVEFFKVTHGCYLKSLKEVDEISDEPNRVYLYPPLSLLGPGGRTAKVAPYCYYKLEPDTQHYCLLCVGHDRKEFTADDIYPQFPPRSSKRWVLKFIDKASTSVSDFNCFL